MRRAEAARSTRMAGARAVTTTSEAAHPFRRPSDAAHPFRRPGPHHRTGSGLAPVGAAASTARPARPSDRRRGGRSAASNAPAPFVAAALAGRGGLGCRMARMRRCGFGSRLRPSLSAPPLPQEGRGTQLGRIALGRPAGEPGTGARPVPLACDSSPASRRRRYTAAAAGAGAAAAAATTTAAEQQGVKVSTGGRAWQSAWACMEKPCRCSARVRAPHHAGTNPQLAPAHVGVSRVYLSC